MAKMSSKTSWPADGKPVRDRSKVVLVDPYDHPIGEMEKMQAHKLGLLHRAFSVFIFNTKGEMLLQQRAAGKYHGAGLWTNACCSHPQWGENVLESATERLFTEMGMRCNLEFSHAFIYQIPVENNLIEHEYDHVFVAYADEDPIINPDEVAAFKWVTFDELQSHMEAVPELYTYWFKTAFPRVRSFLLNNRARSGGKSTFSQEP